MGYSGDRGIEDESFHVLQLSSIARSPMCHRGVHYLSTGPPRRHMMLSIGLHGDVPEDQCPRKSLSRGANCFAPNKLLLPSQIRLYLLLKVTVDKARSRSRDCASVPNTLALLLFLSPKPRCSPTKNSHSHHSIIISDPHNRDGTTNNSLRFAWPSSGKSIGH